PPPRDQAVCRRRRPSSRARPARTNARPGATGSSPAYKPGTAHTVPPSAAPWLLPDLDTTASAPATGPGVVSRHRVAPLTAALVATGRRRWRLPAGCVSTHGRSGGGLESRACRHGTRPSVQRGWV